MRINGWKKFHLNSLFAHASCFQSRMMLFLIAYISQVESSCRVPIKYYHVCGSSEEFYIRPVNPCIDDIDALFYRD